VSSSDPDTLNSVFQYIDEHKNDAVDTLRELVRIPSVTGQELAVQDVVERLFRDRGLEIDRWDSTHAEIDPHAHHVGVQENLVDRPNIVGTRVSDGGGASLLLNAHVDTVPAGDNDEWDFDPFGAEIVDGLLYGRGSCDMKAGLVTFLAALDAIDASGINLNGTIKLNSVSGEEGSGYGSLSTVLRGHRADAAIISEPTRLRLVAATGGLRACRIRIQGKAAHGAMRDEGVSAVEKFIPVLQGILELERELNANRDHPLYSHINNKAPINFGLVTAGNWPSTVPEELIATGRVGVLTGEDPDEIARIFEERVRHIAETDEWLKVHPPEVEWLPRVSYPSEIAADAPLTLAVQRAFETVTGTRTVVEGAAYAADTRLFTIFGEMPCLLFGAGDIAVAHRANEHVPIDDIATATKVYAALILQWTGSV
jgi:acetylornithine deacetylase